MAFLVGITGGICAGKSTVLQQLEGLRQHVLDSDRIVHRLYNPGTPVTEALHARYGSIVANRSHGVNRQLLADRVFNSVTELQWLNHLIHPFVKREIHHVQARLDGILFCAVPLLFEVKWDSFMDCTASVWCDHPTQMARIAHRGWNSGELHRRQTVQLPMEEKLERADYGVINNSTIEILQLQLNKLLKRIARKFGISE